MRIMKNNKGWIKIVEAVISILLVTSVVLIFINQGYIGQKDISSKVYAVELSILREIELNHILRNDTLNAELPMEWNNESFPLELKNKIVARTPSYLNCEAKICKMDDICIIDKDFDKDIYSQAASIVSNLEIYSPRQLKFFCWTK